MMHSVDRGWHPIHAGQDVDEYQDNLETIDLQCPPTSVTGECVQVNIKYPKLPQKKFLFITKSQSCHKHSISIHK
jgi:hypothetical protein